MGCNSSMFVVDHHPASMVTTTEDAIAFMRMQLATCETILLEAQRLRKQLFTMIDSPMVLPSHFLGNLYEDIDEIERVTSKSQSNNNPSALHAADPSEQKRTAAINECLGQLFELRTFFQRSLSESNEVLSSPNMQNNQDIALEFQWKSQTLQHYFEERPPKSIAELAKDGVTLNNTSMNSTINTSSISLSKHMSSSQNSSTSEERARHHSIFQ